MTEEECFSGQGPRSLKLRDRSGYHFSLLFILIIVLFALSMIISDRLIWDEEKKEESPEQKKPYLTISYDSLSEESGLPVDLLFFVDHELEGEDGETVYVGLVVLQSPIIHPDVFMDMGEPDVLSVLINDAEVLSNLEKPIEFNGVNGLKIAWKEGTVPAIHGDDQLGLYTFIYGNSKEHPEDFHRILLGRAFYVEEGEPDKETDNKGEIITIEGVPIEEDVRVSRRLK